MSAQFKIIKPFYCYHPEIEINGQVRPSFWGVEWTIWVKNIPQPTVGIHYQRNVDTEEEAKTLVSELLQIAGEYAPWSEFNDKDWYLLDQYKKCVLGRKLRVISPDPHYE